MIKLEKAIFLDIDGVLALEYGINLPPTDWLWEIAYPFDKECLAVLNAILEETNAEIILTSQWRVDYTKEEIDEIFDWNKIKRRPIAFTEFLGGFCRCKEIELFIENNEIEQFVILDDVELECFPDYFIQTNPTHGLNDALKEKILKLFTKVQN